MEGINRNEKLKKNTTINSSIKILTIVVKISSLQKEKTSMECNGRFKNRLEVWMEDIELSLELGRLFSASMPLKS